jgi:hypothetical protein
MYPSSNLPYLPSVISTILTGLLLFVISIGLLFEALYSWEDRRREPSPPRTKTSLAQGTRVKKSANSSLADPLISTTERNKPAPPTTSVDSTLFNLTRSHHFLITIENLIPIALPILLIVSNLVLIVSVLILEFTFHGSSSLWLIYFCYISLRWLVFIYLVWFNVLYLKALLILLKTLPLFALMISLFFFFIFISGTLGRYIFIDQHIPQNNPYFGSMADSLWTILVAISSSSYPDQIVPSYTDDRAMMIYFFLMITLGSFIFLKLQFVAIFASFESNRQLFELKSSLLRISFLDEAFVVLDSVEQKGYLTYPQVNEVLEELYSYYSGFRKSGVPTSRGRSLLMKAMDRDGNGRIYQEEFMMFLDLTRIQVNEEVGCLFLPSFSDSGPLLFLRSKVIS